MAIIPTIQEQPVSAATRTDTSSGPLKAAAQGISNIAQAARQSEIIDERIRNANRSRRVNEKTTYMTKAVLDNEAELDAVPGAFESYEITHREFVTNLRAELHESAEDSTEREDLDLKLDQISLHSQNRVRRKARGLSLQASQGALEDLTTILSENYAALDEPVDRQQVIDGYDAAVAQAVDDGVVTARDGTRLRQGFIADAEKLRAARAISEDPVTASVMLDEGQFKVTPKDKLVLAAQAQRAIIADQAAEKKVLSQMQQQVWTDYHDAVDQGLVGREDILQAREEFMEGTTTPKLSEQATRALLSRLKARERTGKKKADLDTIYQNSLATGLALDHKRKDHRDAANKAFVDMAPELLQMPPDQANSRVISDIIRPTQVWPEELKSLMRRTAKRGPPGMLSNFASLYTRVRNDTSTEPSLISMAVSDQAFWATIANFDRAGVLTPEAIKLARHNAFELTKEERDAVKIRYREKKYAAGNKLRFEDDVMTEALPEISTEGVGAFIGSVWSRYIEGAPEAPPGAIADYQNLVRTYFELTDDIDESRRLAKEAVIRAWLKEE